MVEKWFEFLEHSVVDSKFTAFFEATTLGNFEAKTTRDHYVASVRIESDVRKADVPNDTNFRFGTIARGTHRQNCTASSRSITGNLLSPR